jgi:filamentous hemagglutinin family protein
MIFHNHRTHSLLRRSSRWLGVSGSLLLSLLLAVSQAQITLDGSLRPSRTLSGPDYTISAAVGRIRGSNLFHSFDQFNIRTGESATFTGPNDIANILSRVTGGQSSTIDGLLRSTIPGANLYLLNPAGVIFGANASLDVRGSFHVSTADVLRLTDGQLFTAIPGPQDQLLTTAAPVAFGFLQKKAAAIRIEGSHLFVLQGETLSAVGGDIEIAGDFFSLLGIPTLSAPSGQISLVSVASPGEVVLPAPGEPSPFNVESFERLGEVTLSDFALIDTSGNGGGTVVIRGGHLLVDNAFIVADTRGAVDGAKVGVDLHLTEKVIARGALVTTNVEGRGNAGKIRIQAGNLEMSQSTIVGSITEGRGEAGAVVVHVGTLTLAGGVITSSSSGPGQGGSVRVTATDTVIFRGMAPEGVPSGILVGAEETGGDAGDVVVRAKHVTLTGGAQISSSSSGPGQGGSVRVIATDTVTLRGTAPEGAFRSGIGANAQGKGVEAGDAGDVVVRAKHVTLTGGAQIGSSSFGRGQGSSVRVTATDTVTLRGTTADGSPSGIFASAEGEGAEAGDAGAVAVRAKHVTLTEGAVISSSTLGSGQGGSVRVTATKAVQLTGTDSVDGSPSGIFARADGRDEGAGKAGSVRVDAAQVAITEGGQISSSTFGPGQGGTVTVTAIDTVAIVGEQSGLLTTTMGRGKGGDVLLRASTLTLTDGARIAAKSTGTADAGTIRLTVTESFLRENSTVTTEARLADGGNIQVTAQKLVRLQDSDITATVGGGVETVGGNITIDSKFVILEGSQILAEAFQGQGGDIDMTAEAVLADATSRISASSTLGIDGTVDIQAPVRNLSGTVAPLPQTFQQVATLLRQRCAERLRGSQASSFVLGGRDSIPAAPSGVLPSLLYEAPVGTTNMVETRMAGEAGSLPPATFLHIDHNGYLHVSGEYAQQFPQMVVDMECAK